MLQVDAANLSVLSAPHHQQGKLAGFIQVVLYVGHEDEELREEAAAA